MATVARRATDVRRALSSLPFRIRSPLAKLQAAKADEPAAFRAPALGDGEALESAKASPDYLAMALRSRVYDLVQETPLQHAPALSQSLGVSVHIKREDTLPTFSFYLRCAINELATMHDHAECGLVTGSVGSRGNALAWAAARLGLRLTVVMPENVPEERRDAVSRLGAEVRVHGATVDESQAEALRLAAAGSHRYVGSHDAPAVLAGAGTVGLELLRQHGYARRALGASTDASGAIDAVFVGVGGGSLLGGVAAVIKSISPSTRVIAVEPRAADVLSRSLLSGHRYQVAAPGSEGVFVSRIGPEVFRLCDTLVDDVILVSDDEICSAIRDVFVDTRAVLEPAGATSIAGAKKYYAQHGAPDGTSCVAVASDAAHIEFDFLQRVSSRTDTTSILSLRLDAPP